MYKIHSLAIHNCQRQGGLFCFCAHSIKGSYKVDDINAQRTKSRSIYYTLNVTNEQHNVSFIFHSTALTKMPVFHSNGKKTNINR